MTILQRAFALQRVRVTLELRAIGFVLEGGAFEDAVLSGELLVAEPDVGPDLRALVAVGALAEVEVGILGFSLGDATTARAVDGLLMVAVGRLGVALTAHFGVDDRIGAGDAAGFCAFCCDFFGDFLGLFRFNEPIELVEIVRVDVLAPFGGVKRGRRICLSKRAAHSALEVVHEADARLALEGTRLDVLLGHFEAREVGVVLVFGSARVADPAALTGGRQCAHGQYADQTKHAGQDRTGHQIVLLKATGAPLLHADCASMTRHHVSMKGSAPRPARVDANRWG